MCGVFLRMSFEHLNPLRIRLAYTDEGKKGAVYVSAPNAKMDTDLGYRNSYRTTARKFY